MLPYYHRKKKNSFKGNLMTLFVNDEKIEKSTIEDEANRLRPHYQSVFKEQTPEEQEKQLLQWAKENIIERMLLLQLAKKDTRQIDPELIKDKYEEWKKNNYTDDLKEKEKIEIENELELQVRVEQIIEEHCKDVPEPTTDQARNFYTTNREQFYTHEQIRAAHIVKHINETTDEETANKEIKQVQKEIKATKNFELVADKHSDCPGNGGDLGYFAKGQMVQEFEDVVFSMKVNQISHIFKTPFGYHITKVLDHRPSRLVGFKNVQDEIKKNLHQEMRNKKVEELLDKLTKEATIKEVE